MTVRISLVDTVDEHTVTWGTAHDLGAAGRLAAAYLAVGSSRTGRTKVVLAVTPDPDPLRCHGARWLDERIEGIDTTRGCPGCPDCHTGGAS